MCVLHARQPSCLCGFVCPVPFFTHALALYSCTCRFVKGHHNIKLKVLKRLAAQILGGLDYLHTLRPPIIHRDVKCENVLYDACAGEVKIGDLGLAMQLVPQAPVIEGPPSVAL